MKSILNALQDGRLIELPDPNKEKAIQYLATLLEAIPDLALNTDVFSGVMEREKSFNTGIGKGWACPHMRSPKEGELLCAIGWSPTGIDYGSPDNQAVHLLVMFFIPEGQKNSYLKEVSSLVHSIQIHPGLQDLRALKDLSEIRNRLLDIITVATQASGPEVRARMIRLEARQSATSTPEIQIPTQDLVKNILPVTIVTSPDHRPLILTQYKELIAPLESLTQLTDDLVKQSWSNHDQYRILAHRVTSYEGNRCLYDCIAIRTR